MHHQPGHFSGHSPQCKPKPIRGEAPKLTKPIQQRSQRAVRRPIAFAYVFCSVATPTVSDTAGAD